MEKYLVECGFEKENDIIIPKSKIIGFERTYLHIT